VLAASLFRVEEFTGDDYSEAQQQAWASAADDEEQFGKALRRGTHTDRPSCRFAVGVAR